MGKGKNFYKHGLSKHRLRGIHNAMIQRCYNKNHKSYKNYGGRGIKVCDRWHDLRNFVNDMYPSFKEGFHLDRIDNDGDYTPNNIRWSTPSLNGKNRRNKCIEQSSIDYVRYDVSRKKWFYQVPFNTQEEAEAFALKHHV